MLLVDTDVMIERDSRSSLNYCEGPDFDLAARQLAPVCVYRNQSLPAPGFVHADHDTVIPRRQ